MRRAHLHPAYWKTLARLRLGFQTHIAVESDALRFIDYPFQPSCVFPTGIVHRNAIGEVNPDTPNQVRLVSGEILFVFHSDQGALLEFAGRHGVPVRKRASIWCELLEPFLDTWQDQATIDRQFARLAECGLSREQVTAWREEVTIAMVAFNFGSMLWEWTQLDLHDVLMAQRARLSRKAFADFYVRAMALAALDPVV